MMDEEDYDDMVERIQKANFPFLDDFYQYQLDFGLSENTASKHLSNIDFYGNEYLLNYEGETLDKGMFFIGLYLGSWFIRKCMWSSPSAIKQNITSFKKFYKWMSEKGHISKEDYAKFLLLIKEEKDEWIETAQKYNDPNVDFEDDFTTPL